MIATPGSAKDSGSVSQSSAVSDSSSRSDSGLPFSMLEIHYNWGLVHDLLTATELQEDAPFRVGQTSAPTTPFLSWTGNPMDGVNELVYADLEKAWLSGIVTDSATVKCYANWDPAWDDDSTVPPNPNPTPDAEPVQVVAYYRGIPYTVEVMVPANTPPATLAATITVTAAGVVTIA